MIEGKRVVAGEAILSGLATTDRSTKDRRKKDRGEIDRSEAATSRVETQDETLETLVRQHSRRHHDAEDATQETFMRVLRYRAKLAEVDEPKTWLARIAWRLAVDRSQRQGRTREIPLDDPEKPMEVPSEAVSADQSMQGAQFGSAVEKLIAALPAKTARTAHPVGARGNVSTRSGGNSGHQRSGGAIAHVSRAPDFEGEA